MKLARSKDFNVSCVVNDHRPQRKNADSGPEAYKVVDSARHLIALGLSTGEIEELGMDQPALQAICEYARLDGEGLRPDSDAVDVTLNTLAEELRKTDLELEMLGMRKRALTSRAKLLQKLAGTLKQRDNDPISD